MDWNRVEGNWKQMKGKIKERYGIARDQIRKDVDDWYNAQRW
jgi:uncharacterized protein YjbJ (UPF0337 family)